QRQHAEDFGHHHNQWVHTPRQRVPKRGGGFLSAWRRRQHDSWNASVRSWRARGTFQNERPSEELHAAIIHLQRRHDRLRPRGFSYRKGEQLRSGYRRPHLHEGEVRFFLWTGHVAGEATTH